MAGDWQRQKVDVICQHTMEGEIIPLRIRLHDEDGVLQTFNIRAYKDITVHDNFTNIWTFDCKILVMDTLRPIRLFYHAVDGVWKIQK